MKKSFTFSVLLSLLFSLWGQTGIPVSEMSQADQLFQNFMTDNNVPGGTFALSYQGRLVYARAFGEADINGLEATQPYHLFRVASVSKSITAIAIMKLIEEEQLSLTDTVFGANGILNSPYYASANISDPRVYDITVQHLLEHTAGWDLNVSGDPITYPLTVTSSLGAPNPVGDSTFVKYILENGLDFTPGTDWAYFNIGYTMLGMIIQAISGKPYESYMQEEIFEPLGIYDVGVSKNSITEKLEREGEYVSPYQTMSCYGTGELVPWQYGGLNVSAMHSHGGMAGSARDLLRLLAAVDGLPNPPDILSAQSLSVMTTPSVLYPSYSRGWVVDQGNNYWHFGSLPGTTSFWARISNGVSWVAILNYRDDQNDITLALNQVMVDVMNSVGSWPVHDFFEAPTLPVSNFQLEFEGEDAAGFSWEEGNGENYLLLAKEGAPVDAWPLDGMNYMDGSFGQGSDLGNGNYVVFNGSGTSAFVQGLIQGNTYHFKLFTFNTDQVHGHPLYLLARSPALAYSPGATHLEQALDIKTLELFPNPSSGKFTMNLELNQPQTVHWNLIGPLGQKIKQGEWNHISRKITHFDLSPYPSGIYIVSLQTEMGVIHQKVTIQH